MQVTNPAANIIEGKHVKDWVNEPYGAFHKACVKNGIKLVYGEPPKERTYEVEIRYEFCGYGYKRFVVEAESEQEAEKKAEAKFQDCDLDFDNAEVDGFDIESVTERKLP